MARLEDEQVRASHNPDKADKPYIFTTLRYDPSLVHSPQNTAACSDVSNPIYLLECHWNRFWEASRWDTDPNQLPKCEPWFWTRTPVQLLKELMVPVNMWLMKQANMQPEAVRLKVQLYRSGGATVECANIPRLPLNVLFPATLDLPKPVRDTDWTVVLDLEPTSATESTKYKTSDRSAYTRARGAANIEALSTTKEVLLYDHHGRIVDASITTPYFLRKGRWVTPAASCGGQQGTTRRWALQQKLCVEEVVDTRSLREGELIWLSNAVRGFFLATLVDGNVSHAE